MRGTAKYLTRLFTPGKRGSADSSQESPFVHVLVGCAVYEVKRRAAWACNFSTCFDLSEFVFLTSPLLGECQQPSHVPKDFVAMFASPWAAFKHLYVHIYIYYLDSKHTSKRSFFTLRETPFGIARSAETLPIHRIRLRRLIHSPIHPYTPFTHSPIHPSTHPPIHPFTHTPHSPIHPFTHPPIRPFTRSPIDPLTH